VYLWHILLEHELSSSIFSRCFIFYYSPPFANPMTPYFRRRGSHAEKGTLSYGGMVPPSTASIPHRSVPFLHLLSAVLIGPRILPCYSTSTPGPALVAGYYTPSTNHTSHQLYIPLFTIPATNLHHLTFLPTPRARRRLHPRQHDASNTTHTVRQ
jgi:hypothetical protein